MSAEQHPRTYHYRPLFSHTCNPSRAPAHKLSRWFLPWRADDTCLRYGRTDRDPSRLQNGSTFRHRSNRSYTHPRSTTSPSHEGTPSRPT